MTPFSKSTMFLSLLFTCVFGVYAFPVAAEELPGKRNFCSRLSQLEERFDARFDERLNRFHERRGGRTDRLDKRQEERLQKLSDHRETTDGRRMKHYETLFDRADTDEEKAAVETFQKDLEAAVGTRRSSVDMAINEYQAGIDKTISERTAALDALITDLRNGKKAAFDKAKSSCDNGTDPKEIRETLRADLKAAHEKFVTERKALGKVADDIKALGETRKTSVQKAIDAFKETADRLRDLLKTAFGK